MCGNDNLPYQLPSLGLIKVASTLPFLPLALDPQPAGSHAQFLGITSVTNEIISNLAAVWGPSGLPVQGIGPKANAGRPLYLDCRLQGWVLS